MKDSKRKVQKGHIVTFVGDGTRGVVVWTGFENKVPVALVRQDGDGVLAVYEQSALRITIVAISAESRIVRERRRPTDTSTEDQGGKRGSE